MLQDPNRAGALADDAGDTRRVSRPPSTRSRTTSAWSSGSCPINVSARSVSIASSAWPAGSSPPAGSSWAASVTVARRRFVVRCQSTRAWRAIGEQPRTEVDLRRPGRSSGCARPAARSRTRRPRRPARPGSAGSAGAAGGGPATAAATATSSPCWAARSVVTNPSDMARQVSSTRTPAGSRPRRARSGPCARRVAAARLPCNGSAPLTVLFGDGVCAGGGSAPGRTGVGEWQQLGRSG